MLDLSLKDKKTIREAVKRGAELLDKKYPTWFKRIDLKTLDLTKACNCIGGQLGQHYLGEADYNAFADNLLDKLSAETRRAMRWYGEPQNFINTIGFCMPNLADTNKFDDDPWQHLNNCWVREIRRRLREAATPSS